MFTHKSESACVACDINCLMETEGLLKSRTSKKLCRNRNVLSPMCVGVIAGVKVIDVDGVEDGIVRQAWLMMLSRCSPNSSKSVTNM